MLRLVMNYAENDKTNKIKTVRCDASYPWPAGKAPWSVEMGGNGIPPQSKRRRSNSGPKRRRSNSGGRTASVASSSERAVSMARFETPSTPLPAPGRFQKPRNAEEAEKMLVMARHMMEKVANFAAKEQKISTQEAVVIKQAIDAGNNHH